MIQRIQSVYLALAAIVAGSLPFVFNSWETTENAAVFAIDKQYLLVGFLISAVMSLASIFMFKNRKSQFVINRLNIILNFILLAVFVYSSLTASGEMEVSDRFRWLAACRSTVIQSSPTHSGMTSDPQQELERLFNQQVLS